MIQQLNRYRTPPDWHLGAPLLLRTLWFCLGAPLLSAHWLPGSAWRVALLRAFGARICHGCRLKPGLRVKFPWRLVVGHHCWLAEDAWIDNLAPVTLGDRVCLSQGSPRDARRYADKAGSLAASSPHRAGSCHAGESVQKICVLWLDRGRKAQV